MVTDRDLQIAVQDLVRRYEELCSMEASTKAVIAYAAFVSGREKLIECVGRDALKPKFNKAIDKAAERQRPQTMPIFPFLLANPIAVVHQQAVGHGGFHTGALGLDRPYVRWVYDCGAWRHVGKQALNRCISDYAEKVRAADRSVDLLFLSHFDVDHVSGVSDLLKKVRVDTVVVPYLEPAAAFGVLAEAVAQERWSSELSRAVLDTIRWLSSFGVRRVVRLRAAVSEGPEGPGVPEGPRPGEPDGASDGDRPLRPVLIGPDGQPLAPTRPHRGRGASIIEAEAGSAFAVRSGANWADWSFLPYVHRISPEARRRLEAAAETLIGRPPADAAFPKLLRDFVRRKDRRKQLRDLYNDKGLGDANAASMSLYVGPGLMSAGRRKVICRFGDGANQSPGWLLTADAKLRNRTRRDEWLKYYGVVPAHYIGTFMLPHHGAAGNFERSILDLAPQASLFVTADSMDPSRPHEDVVAELERYAPHRVQVSKVSEKSEDRLWQVSGPPEAADDPLAMHAFCTGWT